MESTKTHYQKLVIRVKTKQITIPGFSFLSGEFGKEVIEEFNSSVKENYDDSPYLKIFRVYKKIDRYEIVRGSNIPADILINKLLKKYGKRIADLSDLEKMLKIDRNCLRLTYQDLGGVLRDDKEPNSYYANILIKQLQNELRENFGLPVMIPLSSLELIKDSNSPHGFSYRIIDSSQVVHSHLLNDLYPYHDEFNRKKHFSSRDIDVKTGLPTKLTEDGDRMFYGGKSGLSRFFLNRYNELDSEKKDPLDSYSEGRIVVVEEPEIPNKNAKIEFVN